MGVFFEDTYLIDSRDIDLFNFCRPSSLLGHLQDAAADASCAIHISRDEVVAKYNVFWMLARVRVELARPLRWHEPLHVRTWHRGSEGAAMYRDFELTVNGEAVGRAISTWVLADMAQHKLVRLDTVREFAGTEGGTLCYPDLLRKLRAPDALAVAEHRTMHYSDADVNGHVNNVRYADFACDALRLDHLGAGKFVSAFQVGYLKECQPGEVLTLYTGETDESHFVSGVGPEGRPRFQAQLELSPLPLPEKQD